MPTKPHSARSRQATTGRHAKLTPVACTVRHSTQRPAAFEYEPAHLLHPQLVRRSQTPSRAPAAFGLSDPDYAELDESIRTQRGNKMPILVRRLSRQEQGQGPYRYELIAGERRLRACRAHGLPVLATVVANIDPARQVMLTMTENAGRSSLRPFELGRQVIHAMRVTRKSQNEIAATLGHDKGQVSKAAAIAKLPSKVIAAFNSPRDIRYSDLPKLQEALDRASDAVLGAAQKLKKTGQQLMADEVVAHLTAAATGGSDAKVRPVARTCIVPALYVGGSLIANTRLDKAGMLEVSMQIPMSERDQVKLLKQIERFVEKTVLHGSKLDDGKGIKSRTGRPALRK